MGRTEKSMSNDLSLDVVAMIINNHLKKLDIKLQSLDIHIEKVEYDIIDEKNPESGVSTEKYSVFIISSYDKLTNTELIKILEKLQTNAIKQRGMK